MFQAFINIAGNLLYSLLNLLPASPFQYLESLVGDNPFIDAVLWIIPIQPALALLQAWAVAVGIFYAVKIPLRWVKALKL